jgi:hypothetical protein
MNSAIRVFDAILSLVGALMRIFTAAVVLLPIVAMLFGLLTWKVAVQAVCVCRNPSACTDIVHATDGTHAAGASTLSAPSSCAESPDSCNTQALAKLGCRGSIKLQTDLR